MSMSPPPGYPPPPPPGFPPISNPPPVPPPAKAGFLNQFKAMVWWEKVLVIAPLSLLGVGGLIGGLCGGGASAINTSIARSGMAPAARAGLMFSVLIGAYVAYFIVATLAVAAIHSVNR